MATIQNYENAVEEVKKGIDTTQLNLTKAYIVAAESTKGEGDFYIDLKKLDESAARATFTQTFMSTLAGPYEAGINAMPGNPEIVKEHFSRGWFGFNSSTIARIIDSAKGKLSQDGLFKAIEENTEYKKVLEVPGEYAASVMNQVSTEELLAHVGVTAANPDKVTLEDKIKLYSTHRDLDVVPPKMTEGAPYM